MKSQYGSVINANLQIILRMEINVQINSAVMMLSLLKIQNSNKFKNHITIHRLSSGKKNNLKKVKIIPKIFKKKAILRGSIKKLRKK